ncbi:P-loop containing nucleoside triphosphate hydrolase protein [Piedraia hortae CBS 480.64]|uniref:P-loop containing nucleoside triphosphate hydrolase protein n=1 Tax=Piedraia hortae CBS 480.64 TaxID=1314780 RepID=A0A6A7C097_9PEZI|nr:P-loop containing nucleoside triphosphate hydrolase protein [Piedraia hortae CBS 480.64]
MKFPPNISHYVVASPPTPLQLKTSNLYFTKSKPIFLYSAAKFLSVPRGDSPEVAFLGRSNAGKSSLLNAVFNRTNAQDAFVSTKAGRTKTINAFGVSGNGSGRIHKSVDKFRGCVLVDMPGYGKGSHQDWGIEIMKYLTKRKQLRRTFVLLDAELNLKDNDMTLLLHLKDIGVPFQIILSKVDKVLPTSDVGMDAAMDILKSKCDAITRTLAEASGSYSPLDILCTSATKGLHPHRKFGIDELRFAILSASGIT